MCADSTSQLLLRVDQFPDRTYVNRSGSLEGISIPTRSAVRICIPKDQKPYGRFPKTVRGSDSTIRTSAEMANTHIAKEDTKEHRLHGYNNILPGIPGLCSGTVDKRRGQAILHNNKKVGSQQTCTVTISIPHIANAAGVIANNRPIKRPLAPEASAEIETRLETRRM